MNKIECSSNMVTVKDILLKVNAIIKTSRELGSCCSYYQDGEDIRFLRYGNRLFVTNTGVNPTIVNLPNPIPDDVETYMGGTDLDSIFFNRISILEMYFNGDLVFYGDITLYLPQYATDIDLRKFIDDNNPDGLKKIRVINDLVQPSLFTGDMTGLNVTLVNNGEFLGTNPSSTAVTITSPIVLENTGWFKGAGGNGGNGANHGNYSKSVYTWQSRASYDDGGPYNYGIESDRWGKPNRYFNRFWKQSNHAKSGAWVMSGGKNGQEYWNTQSRAAGQAPIWGDQGPCHYNTSGSWCRVRGGGPGLQVSLKGGTYKLYGGKGGHGGEGIHFRGTRNTGRTNGTAASSSGPTNGHDGGNGRNISVPTRSSYNGGNGGQGGTWAVAGSKGGNGGANGGAAGKAIVGSSLLKPGSTALNASNTIGVVS